MFYSHRGLLQLELLVLVALLGLSSALLATSGTAYQDCYHRLQLRTAAQLVAADLRSLQAQVMFKHAKSYYAFTPLQDKSGYTLAYGSPAQLLLQRSFAHEHCEGVYIASSLPFSFSASGSSSSATSAPIVLAHAQLDETISVQLQPVTGRVLVDEE